MIRHLTALEFDKILERLAQFTACPDARELALSLRPESDIDLAQVQMNQTRDAHMLLARFGGPSFGGLRNVNNAAARAGAGSTLSMRELLDVAEVLRTVRALAQWRSTNAGVETVLDPLFSALQPNKYLETKITSAIISEEEITEEKDNPPYTFVLDPIDGTDVYSQGFPSFCIALGILDSNKEPVGAMIYAPRFGVGTDEGAFLRLDPEGELLLNGRKFTMKGDKKTVRQLAVSSTCIWKFDFTKYRGKARSLGCSILHILLPVLFPSIAASINEPSFIWDYAAAHAVIRSQGMDLFAPDGSRYVYSSSFLNRERSETPVYGGEKETVEELIKLCPQREL